MVDNLLLKFLKAQYGLISLKIWKTKMIQHKLKQNRFLAASVVGGALFVSVGNTLVSLDVRAGLCEEQRKRFCIQSQPPKPQRGPFQPIHEVTMTTSGTSTSVTTSASIDAVPVITYKS